MFIIGFRCIILVSPLAAYRIHAKAHMRRHNGITRVNLHRDTMRDDMMSSRKGMMMPMLPYSASLNHFDMRRVLVGQYCLLLFL